MKCAPSFLQRKVRTLPDHARPTRISTTEAVANILAGQNAHGTAPLGFQVPFTNCRETRQQASLLLNRLLFHLNDTLLAEHLTPLTSKLLVHLSKTGLQSPEAINTFPVHTLADAIREAPHLLASKAGISAILRGHQRRTHQSAAVLRRTLSIHVPERSLIWQDGDYRLEEAQDPRHLQQDSAALNHCVGTAYNTDALKHFGLTETDSAAIHFLHYWISMKKRECRIFTLTSGSMPIATLEYDVPSERIVQISGKNDDMVYCDDLAFIPLCKAVHALRGFLPLAGVSDLQEPGYKLILTANGTFEVPTPDNLNLALSGTVVLEQDAPASLIKAAISEPLINVDVSDLDPATLAEITQVRGNLVSWATTVSMPSLTTCRDINFYSSKVDLPALKSCGTLTLNTATTINIPQLSTCEDISIDDAMTVSFQSLRFCEDIYIKDAWNVALPVLERCASIYLQSAVTAELPALQRCRELHFDCVSTLDMPALHVAGNINLIDAREVRLQALQSAADIYLRDAETVSLPALTSCKSLYMQSTTPESVVDLRSLKSCQKLEYPATTSVNCPLYNQQSKEK